MEKEASAPSRAPALARSPMIAAVAVAAALRSGAAAASRRHRALTLDPEKLAKKNARSANSAAEAFTPEQLAECQELFMMFDRNGDMQIDRSEFGPMMRTLGLNLSERELDMFFDRMDANGDGMIVFPELVHFLEKISQPITLDEELAEAFRFFEPSEIQLDDQLTAARLRDLQNSKVITSKSLARVLNVMGEDISETECLDMIMALTGGKEVVDFPAFKAVCKGKKSITRRASYLEENATLQSTTGAGR